MLRRLFSSTGFECLGWQTGGEEAAGWLANLPEA